MNKFLTLLSNLFIGIPGGALIFMGMLMFQAVLGLFGRTGEWSMLIILCLTSLITGMLATLVRPINGFGAAVASGLVAAGIILVLRLASAPESANNTLVFSPVGMTGTLAFSTFGGWLFPRLRKHKK